MGKDYFEKYYEDGKLVFSLDIERGGYLLEIGEFGYFIDSLSYQSFKNSKGLNLIDKLKSYNSNIIESLEIEKVLPSKLEDAFICADKKIKKEFEEFRKKFLD